MKERTIINERRLKKKQVQSLIEGGAVFNKNLTDLFNYGGLESSKVEIYNLSDGNYLMVFREEFGINGKGDIWIKEHIDKQAIGIERRKKRDLLNIPKSIEGYWFHYSKNKNNFKNRPTQIAEEVFEKLSLKKSNGDYSYPSLDILSQKINELDVDYVEQNLLDDILAYVGEVIRKRVDGKWIFRTSIDSEFNVEICTKNEKVLYKPLVSLYEPIFFGSDFDLRKFVINEIRSNSRRKAFWEKNT